MLEFSDMLDSFESSKSSDDSLLIDRPPFLASDSLTGFFVAFGFLSLSRTGSSSNLTTFVLG